MNMMTKSMPHTQGRSLIGVIVVFACLVVLGSIAFAILWSAREGVARRALDATHVRQILGAQALLTSEFDVRLAVSPGLLKRLPVAGLDRIVAGVGPEDVTQNTTANFYSMLIAQNYVTPEQCIGPTEPSGRVVICEGYDWSLFKPDAGIYWDPGFQADLSQLSNTSYAHLPLFPPASRSRHWGSDGDADVPLVGNRGPRGGKDAASITYAIHDPRDQWVGHVGYRDNHVELIGTFTPRGADNIFAYDDGVTGDDAVLSFTRQMNEDGPTLQHD